MTDVHHSLKGTPGCQTLIKQDSVSALQKAGWTNYFSFLVSSGRPTFKKKKKSINKKSESWWEKDYNDLPSSGQSNLSRSSRNAASLLLRLICLFAAYRAAISILEREQSKAQKCFFSFNWNIIGPFFPFMIKKWHPSLFPVFFRNAIDPFSPIYRGPLLYLLLLYTNPTLFSCQSPTCFLRVGQSCCENVKYWFIMGN